MNTTVKRPAKLLGVGTNAKTVKGDNLGEYLTAIMYLSPHKDNTSGMNLCPKASKGCVSACLYTAGRGAFSNVQRARRAKSDYFIEDRASFLTQLDLELRMFSFLAKREGKKPAVRLNGTSDVDWGSLLNLSSYPEIEFYDYTKVEYRMGKYRDTPNLHLTFSKDENSKESQLEYLLSNKMNVAAVFSGKTLPDTYLGYPVINGDLTDLRFLDERGVIVGLLAKGQGKKDTSGFVIHQQKVA